MRISDWSSDVCSSDLIAAGRFSPQLPTRIYDDGFPVSKEGEEDPRNAVFIRLGISLPNFKSEEAANGRKGEGMLTRRSIARRTSTAQSNKRLGTQRPQALWGLSTRPSALRAPCARSRRRWCTSGHTNTLR